MIDSKSRLIPPPRDIYDTMARFTWWDYICLSYTYQVGDMGKNATIIIDGVPVTVSNHLEAALGNSRATLK